MKLRFLLDEHVNRAVQRQLRRLDAQIEVLAVGDPGAPPASTSDPDILAWQEENGYILITENRSTIPIEKTHQDMELHLRVPSPFQGEGQEGGRHVSSQDYA